MIADVVVVLQYGDCGKGKLRMRFVEKTTIPMLLDTTEVVMQRHTIYHNGKKFVTHHIPCGVFWN